MKTLGQNMAWLLKKLAVQESPALAPEPASQTA
jgi:hypothetical protein